VISSRVIAMCCVAFAALALQGAAGTALVGAAWADDARQEACKAAMNARIQVCTDDCTQRALAAASHYVDTNHNVKFGCLKGCAIGQILQMRACAEGKNSLSGDPTETNSSQ
jgi:hypothetical protein